MDFFEAQDAARRRTGLLVFLFAAAVLGIVAVIYVVAHLGLGEGDGIDPLLLGQVALGVGLVVGLGSVTRTASLRRGGPAVAELLGGRRVSPDTSDLEERKLLNVVEEMAIASGTPVPAVYVLDNEDGINAFAAGYSLHDAAVAVTRGALHTLTRDELQGVMAHEFSHILNGDMRLNIRLIGLLHGILLLALIGRGIVHFGPRGRRGGRDGGGGYVIILGIALLLVGYIGVFFGKLIKAAVSRQREYLADSAAVEFTRNPDGLAGALKKIAAEAYGSRIVDHRAEELSHLFFANGLRSSMFGFLSTHPPIDDRIRRLDPAWTGELIGDEGPGPSGREHRRAAAAHGFEAVAAAAPPPRSAASAPTEAAPLVSSVGAPTSRHLEYAADLLANLPDELGRAAHEPAGAVALLFALALAEHGDDPIGREVVSRFGGPDLEDRALHLVPLVTAQGAEARLPLLDLALPALKTLSPAESARLRESIEEIVRADGRVRLFEFAMIHILTRRLEGPAGHDRGGGRIGSFGPVRSQTGILVSAMAWAGSRGDEGAARAAFEAGARSLPNDARPISLADRSIVSIEQVDRSLTAFERGSPAVRRRLLEACAVTAMHDDRLERVETELLRAISEALDCPMPPDLRGR
jgi:Zn-dependent protease with chaperone function